MVLFVLFVGLVAVDVDLVALAVVGLERGRGE